MRFSVDLKIAHLRKQQQFYHLLAAGKVVRPPGREGPFLDRLEQGVGEQKNSKAPVPLPRYATQLPAINRRFQGPGKDETCCSPLLFSSLQNKHHARWWPQGPSTDNSPCRVDLHCHPLRSLISQQAPLPTETCDVQHSFPAYYVKLASEAHRHWEHCTVGDLDCLTCSIGKLFFFYFWNECLNMAPSFAKQIKGFIRIIVTCTITLQNVLICNMPTHSVLTPQSPSGPPWFLCKGNTSKQMGFSLSYETNLHCYFQNLDRWGNRTQSYSLHFLPFSFLLSFLPPFPNVQKEQG